MWRDLTPVWAVPRDGDVSPRDGERRGDGCRAPRWDPPPRVDYATVRRLHRAVADELAETLRSAPPTTDAGALGERIAARHVRAYVDTERLRGHLVTDADEAALRDAVVGELAGLGRLRLLLADPEVENVHVLGHDRVRVERSDGTVIEAGPVADSDDDLRLMLQALARQGPGTERALTTARPLLDRQLVDGSRLAAADQVTPRPYAAIRRHRHLAVTLEQLVELGTLDELTCRFLAAAVDARANIMVAGPADAGKTTLLRALADRIPRHEPFVVLEESRELDLHTTGRHPWAMSFEAREGHGERGPDGRPEGQITLDDLIAFALRMSAPRIIVGEVRSHEIVAMLKAMRSSLGSMCTIHARSAASVVDRIVELALSHGPGMSAELAERMAAGCLDLIVYLTLRDERPSGGGKLRYVSDILEVQDGFANGRLVTTRVFGPGPDGRAVPRHLPERLTDRLRAVGYDPRELLPFIEAEQGAWRSRERSG
ncbi:MAG: CpaF/VirB11 family protein [Micromonosporaceae bacterium]